jgi:hypothetical protein
MFDIYRYNNSSKNKLLLPADSVFHEKIPPGVTLSCVDAYYTADALDFDPNILVNDNLLVFEGKEQSWYPIVLFNINVDVPRKSVANLRAVIDTRIRVVPPMSVEKQNQLGKWAYVKSCK